MIKSLSIQNYALIEKLDMQLFKGLNIITGETGAGKSILLGSLELAMGKRADHSVLYDKDKKCIVEVVYDISQYNLKDFFAMNDMDYDDEMIVRRVISPNGKSRAFINDEPVNLTNLKEISAHLIQMHRQFDNLELNSPSYQLKLIDVFGENISLVEEYSSLFKSYQIDKKQLNKLKEDNNAFKKEMQFIEYQYNELNDASITVEEFNELEDSFNNLNNAESIKSNLLNAYNALIEGEFSIINRIDPILSDINNVELRSEKFEKTKESFYDAIENIREAANEFLNISENTEYDEEKIADAKVKLDTLYNLMNKHKVDSIEKLIDIKEELNKKLQKHFDVDKEIEKLSAKIEKTYKKLRDLAEELTQKRKKTALSFSKQVVAVLKELALPHSQLKVDINATETLNETGQDKVTFLFTANKGGEFKTIKEAASGGELSRLALSIESTIADKMALPTMIFDEIEAGISGEVARKMGYILKGMSAKHQLINITHSPQIAAKADYHYFVYKDIIGDKTITNIRLLNKNERIVEIAKTLSGDPPTEGALKNANELINLKIN